MSTSTVTILETYDTHMIDYPTQDSDIPMLSGTIQAESWYSLEDRTMEDDSAQSHSEPIEIEMANDDEYVEEYDMADAEIYYAEDTELVDVEVIDQHNDASSSVLPVENAHNPELTPAFLEPPSMLPSVAPSPSMQHVDLSAPIIGHDWPLTHSVHSELPADEPPVAAEPSATIPSDTVEATSISTPVVSVVEVVEPTEVAPAPVLEAQPAIQEVLDGEFPNEEEPVAEVPASAVVEVQEHTEEHIISNAEPGHEVVDETNDETNVDTFPLPDENSLSVADPADHSESADHVPDNEHADLEVQVQEGYDETLENFQETQESQFTFSSGADPHEISEGIFIDPPPAVLIEVTYSSEQFEYSLFNQPASGSGSRTPTADAPPQQPQAYSLLLQERPTLYYEPLGNVFAALRLEGAVNSIPELVEGELILDAYDLQLVASEDNAHLHEVTLHELNELHDGADLTGPLRLRLYARSPRFITRYHALREQISRLGLGEEEVTNTHEEHTDTYEDQPLTEPVAETEEQQLLSSDNYANSDAHTALPEEEGQDHQQPEEEYQEHYDEHDEHDTAPPEDYHDAEEVEPPTTEVTEVVEDSAAAVSDDVDDAYADDTTEGTEEGEIAPSSNANEEDSQVAVTEENPVPTTYDDTAPAPDEEYEDPQHHEEYVETHETHETDELHAEDEASQESLEYYDDDTTNPADANTDEGLDNTTSNSHETQEDDFETSYDEEEAQNDFTHDQEDEFEDYADDFDDLAPHDEQAESEQRPPSLTVQTGETLAEVDDSEEDPSSASAHYDTPASRVSKRSFDLVDPDFEDYEEYDAPSSPPDSKRQRTD